MSLFIPYDNSLPSTILVLPTDYPRFTTNNPYTASDIKIVGGNGHENEGAELGYNNIADGMYLYNSQFGGSIYYGYPYTSTVILPPIITRDKAGIRMTEAKKRLNSVIVSVEGSVVVNVNSLPTQTHHMELLDTTVTDAKFQAKALSNEAHITLTASQHDPMDLNQCEWTGLYYKAGRRF